MSLHAPSFSWRGLLLAPLVVPVAFATLLVLSSPGKSPVFGFAFITGIGAIISYPTVLFLFVPCLMLLSRWVRFRWYWVALLGAGLGVVIFIPIEWIMFKSSGPDSGPPVGTFLEFLWRGRCDVFNLVFPLSGLITAVAYWLLQPCSAHDTASSFRQR